MNKIDKVEIVIKNQLADIKAISGINSLILSVCLVDTIAGFYCGYEGQKSGNKTRYLKFVETYLEDYKDHLYDIRCNLTHSFSNTLAKFMFVDDTEYSQVFPNLNKFLDWQVFDIGAFKSRLEESIDMYFQELRTSDDSELLESFNKRLAFAGILQDGVIPTLRTIDGKMVRHISDIKEDPETGLKIALEAPTKTKK